MMFSEKFLWQYMNLRAKIVSKFAKNKYKGYCLNKKQILDFTQGNTRIYELLSGEAPCMIARFGASEMRVVSDYTAMLCGIRKEISDESMSQLCKWSGFFPNEKSLGIEFAKATIQAAGEVDLLGVWRTPMEEYTILKYAPNAEISYLQNLEPWFQPENPWSRVLAGKKVLVIHPFESTIQRQFNNRGKLFPGTDILPEFELHTLKAVQTVAGQVDDRFVTWFDALQYMYDEAMKIDFDIAIIGCGAYGFLLAAMLKKAGKKVVHMGGATQLLFGIRGKRWDEIE